jgi:hypothetical protein
MTLCYLGEATDISEKYTASIFSVNELAKQLSAKRQAPSSALLGKAVCAKGPLCVNGDRDEK